MMTRAALAVVVVPAHACSSVLIVASVAFASAPWPIKYATASGWCLIAARMSAGVAATFMP